MNSNLEDNARKFAQQAQRQLRAFNATDHIETGVCCPNTHEPTRAHAVIGLHDIWVKFCRQLLIDSCEGDRLTRGGVYISRSAVTPTGSDVIAVLRSTYRNRASFWEPSWSKANDYIDACRRMRIQNLTQVSAAVGVVSSPSEQLRLVRNYLAHKNETTAQNARASLRAYGVANTSNINVCLQSAFMPRTSLYEYWVNELTSIAFVAVS